MKNVVHFNSPQARMKYLKGEFEEIVPIEVEEKPKETKKEQAKSKKGTNSAKKRTNGKKNDDIQAE